MNPRRRARMWLVLLLMGCLGPCAALAPEAGARLLVKLPASLADQVKQPCVLYLCATNPAPHTNWENTLGTLPADYCAEYTCSPMDLIADNGFDDNLFPLNPDWAYFTETGQPPDANALCQRFTDGLGSPPCSTYPVGYDAPGVDTLAYFVCPLGRDPKSSFHGHVNWEPATYQGNLIWDSKSDVGTDDDYSLDLQTVGGHGATTGNAPGTIHLEFDSDETIDHFDSSPWWQHFHNIVDNGYGAGNPNGIGPGKPPHHQFGVRGTPSAQGHAASVGDYINGDFAVVTGLIGIDTAHTPGAESHPVYAMAIQSDRQQALGGGTDTWAIFARNFGNEGYCSQHDHPLPAGPITLRIPWQSRPSRLPGILPPRPATQVTITSTSDLWSNIKPNGTGSVSIIPGEGVLLTLNVSEPASDQPLFWGTIDLKWTWSSVPPPSELASFAPFGPGAAVTARADGSSDGGENSDVESIAHRLWERLPAAARARAFAELPQPHLKLVSVRSRIAMAGPPEAPLRPLSRFITPNADPPQVALGRSEEQQMCAAYRDRVPGHPAICASARRL